MNRIITILFCGLVSLSAASCVSQPTPIAKSRNIELDDLWEDTPTTKGLFYTWRVYRRYQLSNRLHEQLRLYLTCPEDWQRGDRRPAVVFIHGGGWGQGDASQWFPQCRYFALRGLVGVSVDYRLKSDTTTIADCVIDCKSAIRYLRKNAGQLGIDPKKIIVAGESAGGHLAAALGTIEEYDAAGDDVSISPVPNVLILLNPITDMTTHWGDSLGSKAGSLSPLHHISNKTPPTLLIHGDSDTVVDIRHSRAFHEKMIFLGNYSRLLVLPGADHAFAVFKYSPENFNKQAIIEMDHYLVSLGYLDGNAILHAASNPKAMEGH